MNRFMTTMLSCLRAKYTLIVALLAISLLAPSCRQDDLIGSSESESASTRKEFKLLEVKSYLSGNSLGLDLDLTFADDQLRSVSFLENAETGELSGFSIGDTERVHIFLRKEGDDRSLTMATLTWQGRQSKKIALEKIKVALPEGYSVEPGESWYITGILGGELDVATKTVRMGGQGSSISLEASNTADVPYIFPWKKLTINRTNNATIGATTMKPRGALLRMHFYNDLIEAYDAQGVRIKTNAWRTQGHFNPISTPNNAAQEGLQASWTAVAADDQEPVEWRYSFGSRTMPLPSGAGRSPERTLFLWGMPTTVASESTTTEIGLSVSKAGSGDTPKEFTTYSKQRHRTLAEGNSYRMSNVLTVPLMISEIYYQYAPSYTNQEDSRSNRNYSIVEIYNPTLSDVDLTDYALVRTAPNESNRNIHGYFSAGLRFPDQDLLGAAFLPLGVSGGTTQHGSKFPSNRNVSYQNAWFKTIYGTPGLKLPAGKTLLVGAAGYVHTAHKPSKNIELFNEMTDYVAGTDTRSIEKDYLPRAGMQADSATHAGFAAAMIAIDNSGNKDRDPNAAAVGGVLQLGNGQGIALVKVKPGKDNAPVYEVVDISTPLGDQAQSNAYLSWLRSNGQPTGIYQPMSYSIVRVPNAVGSPKYNISEWQISETENDGVKSIGTRNYIAGLSPFKSNYTGYNQTNNPTSKPFWGDTKAPTLSKGWGELPERGGNMISDGSKVKAPVEQVRVVSGWASENHQGGTSEYTIDKSFDSNLNTFYHSKDKRFNPSLPITLTYRFDQAESLEHITYIPRDQNGSINDYDIEVTYEDGTTARMSMPSLGSPTEATEIRWAGMSTRPVKQVSFIVKTTHYGVLAVKEMQFFKHTDGYYDPSQLFVDKACTILRPELTPQQIMAVPDPFYREMARKMRQGSYQREFRIADYKAWTDPNFQQRINKNQFPYSIHDNPTGMSFKKGEEVVVFVDDTHGHNIRLKVMDAQTTGFNGVTYKLVSGINKIKMASSGLGYILYHVNELDVNRVAHPNIRIHFAEGSGRVNGYFDSQNPAHNGRWKELINKAVDPHFDVLGQYAHLTYNTGHFRHNTPDGVALINNYDKIVFGEQQLMGVVKTGNTFRNRMLFLRVYDSFMYATSHRTAYNMGDASSSVAASLMDINVQKDWTWGAAHEVGHMNQTIGLNWGGMIEITNNIHSFYVEANLFKSQSRSLRIGNSGSNFYTPAWNALFETDRTLTSESRSSNSLVPFLQLQMYLGNVLGMSPDQRTDHDGFYPKLYQYLREATYTNSKTAEDNGFQQTELTYHASRAAGYDLTKFFERWGFYREVRDLEHFNTYGTRFVITVTADQVRDVKARIAALRLPEPPLPFEYITPLNEPLYRAPANIVKGSIAISGSTITLANWQNVAAWEIRDASGKLLHTDTGGVVRPGSTYTINYPAWHAGLTLNAISVRGQRVQAN